MEEKFETLWLRYKRPIFGYLLAHARQPADAEDLLQIVAYKALKNFSSLRNPAKFYSWIFAIAKHVVADYHRTAVPESVFIDGQAKSSHHTGYSERFVDRYHHPRFSNDITCSMGVCNVSSPVLSRKAEGFGEKTTYACSFGIQTPVSIEKGTGDCLERG